MNLKRRPPKGSSLVELHYRCPWEAAGDLLHRQSWVKCVSDRQCRTVLWNPGLQFSSSQLQLCVQCVLCVERDRRSRRERNFFKSWDEAQLGILRYTPRTFVPVLRRQNKNWNIGNIVKICSGIILQFELWMNKRPCRPCRPCRQHAAKTSKGGKHWTILEVWTGKLRRVVQKCKHRFSSKIWLEMRIFMEQKFEQMGDDIPRVPSGSQWQKLTKLQSIKWIASFLPCSMLTKN